LRRKVAYYVSRTELIAGKWPHGKLPDAGAHKIILRCHHIPTINYLISDIILAYTEELRLRQTDRQTKRNTDTEIKIIGDAKLQNNGSLIDKDYIVT